MSVRYCFFHFKQGNIFFRSPRQRPIELLSSIDVYEKKGLNSTQQLSTINTTSKRKKKDLSTIEHKKDHNMLEMQELAWGKHEMWWVKPAGLGKARDVVG